MRKIVQPLLLLSVAVFAVACSGTAASSSLSGPGASSAPAGTAATQTSERAGVTIAATWNGPSSGAAFELKLDNHMVDLASVDMSKATLANDRGDKLTAPVWTGGASGHHREGRLTFESTTAFFSGASSIQLELPAVGDASPRDFDWKVGK